MKIDTFVEICRQMLAEGWAAAKVDSAIRLAPPKGWHPSGTEKFCDCLLVAIARREFIRRNDRTGAATLGGEDDFEEAAKQLDILHHTRKWIILATDSPLSDNDMSYSDRLLRIRFLSAFKLGPDRITDSLWQDWGKNRQSNAIRIQHIKLCNAYADRIAAEKEKRRRKRGINKKSKA